MAEALLLDRCGYLILAVLVIGEQIGIPLPAVPALLGVGSLAADGRISLPLVLSTVAAAGLTADLVWFELGRRRGRRVLDALRRISRAPDARLHRAENLIRRYAVPAVLIAKFIPGLTSVTPPLAGIFGIARARFLLYDLAGILLWAGTWSGLGYVFSDAIGAAVALAAGLGAAVGLVVVTVAVVYVLLKRIPWRWRFPRGWMARLAPQHGQGSGDPLGRSGGTPACGHSVRPSRTSASPAPRPTLGETPRSVSERACAEAIHNRSETQTSVVARKLSETGCHDHPHSALQD